MTDATVRELLIALITLLIGGGGGGFIVAMRKDRREADRDAPRDTVDTLNLMLQRVVDASTVAADAVSKANEARDEATAARVQAQRAEDKVNVLKRVLRLHVMPLIVWIDRGATPPAPPVAQELRSLLEDLDET